MGWPRTTSSFPEPTPWNGDEPDPHPEGREDDMEPHEEPFCRCGSGLYRRELRDAAGIFCAFVCDDCEEATKARFNPAIFESGTLYGATGEEQDIGVRRGEDY